ncbi:hypothetical protein PJF56_09965 [Roseofilum sp. BLCC_M91]|uniref:LamG-like jellyroll fold domain-containing protein n=1 Tax=Roseofilum halophilum BLCC-M91 TaxID=3022259 RepID=A0ABT7BJ55_9CYAN|nr:LamG-like jellyroll fold domain-containing protein [Roseofilum halophilum]MDJ1179191.1 hypothetical protein [Roseofilum halophilum BLCC-M91]
MSNSQSVLTFDGIDDYISVEDRPSLQISTYTVEVWVKPNGKPNQAWKGIVGKPGRNYHIWIHNAGYVHHRFHTNKSTNAGAPNTPNGSLAWDRWSHVAITNDGTTAKTYINGELKAEGLTGGTLIVDKTPLYVARRLDEASGNYFKGQIADLRIWNQVRSPEEIKNRMGQRLTGNESGLVAYWPLNEGSGTTAGDKTSNGNQGTIHGATWTQENLDFITPAPTESALPSPQAIASFNGSNQYIEVPYKKELNPAQFTVSCWAKVEGGQGQWRSPVTCRTAKGSSALGGYLLYAGNNNKWQFWTGNGGWVTLHGAEVVLNTWTHVAATYDGSTMKLYINGELSGKPVQSKILINSQHPLRIGAGITEGNPGFFFNGKIAEVRLWDRACSQEEIQESMHQRLRGDELGLIAYWSLDQESGTSAEDKTGKGNPGTLHGATWETSALPLTPPEKTDSEPSALMFDGIDDYVSLPIESIPEGKEITISFWAKGASSLPKQCSVFFAYPTPNFNPSKGKIVYTVNIHLPWSNSNIYFDCGSDGNTYNRIYKAAQATDFKDKWTHWAFTLNANTGKMAIYLNGDLWCEGSNKTLSIPKPGEVKIGSGYGFYHGSLSEVRVWDRELSGTEVKDTISTRLTGREPGLVSYWPLDEGTGTTAEDKSGNNHHGTINGATWETSGLELSPAPTVEPSETPSTETTILTFDGVDDYVNIPSNATLDVTDNFTIEAWIKPEVLGKRIVDKTIGGKNEGFTFDTYPQNLRFINKGILFTSRTPLETGTWQHVAVTFKHEANGAKLYINGEEDNVATPSRVGTVTKLPVRLGSQADKLGNLFKGEMAEVRIWNRVRSPEEIKASMNQRLAGAEEGLMGYWPLNEGTGTTAEDNTSNGNTGTVHGGTWGTSDLSLTPAPEPETTAEETEVEEEALSPASLMFDGLDDYVAIPNSEWESSAFSVELWAKASQKQSNYVGLLSSSNDPTESGSCQIDAMGGFYRLYHSDIQVRIAKVNQEWQHLVVTYDGTAVQTYLNGEPQNLKAIDAMTTVFKDYVLGRNRNGDKYFAGELSDVRIWDRALTADEIQEAMGYRLTGDESGLVAYWPLDEGKGSAIGDRTGNTQPGVMNGATWQTTDLDLSVAQDDSDASPDIPQEPEPASKKPIPVDRSVISITVLKSDEDFGGRPDTLYGKSSKSKKRKKKRKKHSKFLSPYEKYVRELAKRQDEATHTYVERHKRSNRKKKDGWLKDFVKNYSKSVSKLF